MLWNREHVRILINEYKRHPCLYMVKTKQYTNKHAKHLALPHICGMLQARKPAVTINEIKTKFQGLKTTLLADYRTHKDSLGTGNGADEICIILLCL